MAHERTQPPFEQLSVVPPASTGLGCRPRRRRPGEALPQDAEPLGRSQGMLGLIFRKAQNKVQDSPSSAGSELIDREH